MANVLSIRLPFIQSHQLKANHLVGHNKMSIFGLAIAYTVTSHRHRSLDLSCRTGITCASLAITLDGVQLPHAARTPPPAGWAARVVVQYRDVTCSVSCTLSGVSKVD